VEELLTEPNNFLENLRNLSESHGVNWPDIRVLAALSGGLDSVCMLRLLDDCKTALGFQLKAIHFNHGLRGEESDSDSEFCRDLCNDLGLELTLIDLQIDKQCPNLQSIAREQRKHHYDHWKRCGINHLVATAHHKDDFMESFFIGVHQGRLDERLIPLKVIDLTAQLLRPLVTFNKNDLLGLAVRCGWVWREDSSNLGMNYLRNFYRKELLQESNLIKSLSNFTNFLVLLDSDLRAWLENQLEWFEKRGNYLDRNECFKWEAGRFRDFWLAVLQRYYPQFLKNFDAKRLRQVRIEKYRGNRRFQIGSIQSNSSNKLYLVETLRGYHLEIEEAR
tara:strand:- start:539 stop:1540 length:1002 start_codon:yes stop_codon:yes gene_type:complete